MKFRIYKYLSILIRYKKKPLLAIISLCSFSTPSLKNIIKLSSLRLPSAIFFLMLSIDGYANNTSFDKHDSTNEYTVIAYM